MSFHVCYATLMTTKTDALIHLPTANTGPWKRVNGRYERYVSFDCDYRKRHYAILRVYGNGKGGTLITIKIDGFSHAMSVGEHADPFSVANEIFLALSSDCDCHNNPDGESL